MPDDALMIPTASKLLSSGAPLAFIGRVAWTFRSVSVVVAVLVFVGVAVPVGAEEAPLNTLTLTEASGATQTNRVVSVARPFRRGEVRNFAQASAEGIQLQTQNDVKNR